MAVTRFGQVQADAYLGAANDNSPFGKIWYVDGTNGSDGNVGDSPDEAFSTVGAAISAAVTTRGDTVVMYPGSYTITSALVAKAGMTFRAAIVNPHAPSVIIQGNIAELVTVDVSYVRFIGIEFRGTGTTCSELVDVADGANVSGPLFEDCRFATTTGGAVGIAADDGTYYPTGLVVRRCLFDNESKSQLEIGIKGAPFCKIEDNVFVLRTTTSTGIALAATTGATQSAASGHGYVIRNNDFVGLISASHVGITLYGTEDKLATGIIRSNHFGNFVAAAITANKATRNMVNNYVGDTGTGGTIVDAGN